MHDNRFNFKPVQPLQYQHWSDGQKSDINIASECMHAFFQQTNHRHHPLLTTTVTDCAVPVAQQCYNGDVRFLWEKLEFWPPVKFKPLNRLSQNLSQLITSTRGTFSPSLVNIRLRGTSGQIGEMSLSCDFFIYLFIYFSEARSEIKPFDRIWRAMAQNQSRLNVFWGPGPAELMGPLPPLSLPSLPSPLPFSPSFPLP